MLMLEKERASKAEQSASEAERNRYLALHRRPPTTPSPASLMPPPSVPPPTPMVSVPPPPTPIAFENTADAGSRESRHLQSLTPSRAPSQASQHVSESIVVAAPSTPAGGEAPAGGSATPWWWGTASAGGLGDAGVSLT